jgi:hypothetical protein
MVDITTIILKAIPKGNTRLKINVIIAGRGK